MKNLLTCLFFILFSFQLKSQVEISTNPLALLFEAGVLGLEYIPNQDWGVGLDMFGAADVGFVYASGKHYFNPKVGGDRFNVGAFIGGAGDFGDTGFGLGFFGGYKWISSRNITLDLALGAGRDFSDVIGVLPYVKFNIGYRFPKKGKK